MQLELSNREVSILRTLVDNDRRQLLMEIANTDSLEFKDELIERSDLLDGIAARLDAASGEAGSRRGSAAEDQPGDIIAE
jgi:hypothetical protein